MKALQYQQATAANFLRTAEHLHVNQSSGAAQLLFGHMILNPLTKLPYQQFLESPAKLFLCSEDTQEDNLIDCWSWRGKRSFHQLVTAI